MKGAGRDVTQHRRPDPATRRGLNTEVGDEPEAQIEAEIDKDALNRCRVGDEDEKPEGTEANYFDGAEDEKRQRARLVIKMMRSMRQREDKPIVGGAME